MEIKVAVFDIDGTLVPYGAPAISAQTCAAITKLRAQNVVVIIATGRALFNAKQVLSDLPVDYYVCANGNWVTNATGRLVHENRLISEEMYALVDYFEDYTLPLNFIFDDGYHVYVEYQAYCDAYKKQIAVADFLFDGEDQVRHLQSMPYAASAIASKAHIDAFQEKYGHLGLNFVAFGQDHYDVIRAQTDKAVALENLLEKLGCTWQQAAAFGDGDNDITLLQKSRVFCGDGQCQCTGATSGHCGDSHSARRGRGQSH